MSSRLPESLREAVLPWPSDGASEVSGRVATEGPGGTGCGVAGPAGVRVPGLLPPGLTGPRKSQSNFGSLVSGSWARISGRCTGPSSIWMRNAVFWPKSICQN